MFRKQRWAMFWLLVVAMILSPATVWCQPPADAPQTPAARPGVDVGYITPDAAAAVVAYPRHILTDPAMEMLPLEVITVLGERDFGIDPVQVEQLLAIAEPPQKGPPGAVVVLRPAAPLAEDKLHAPAWDHTEEAQLDGKTYFRGRADGREHLPRRRPHGALGHRPAVAPGAEQPQESERRGDEQAAGPRHGAAGRDGDRDDRPSAP